MEKMRGEFRWGIKFLLIILVTGCCINIQTVPAHGSTVNFENTITKTEKPDGLVKSGTRYYYYVKGKPVKNTWKTINNAKYYFGKDGKAKVWQAEIKGVYYFFRENGKLYCPKKPTLISSNKYTFYVDKNGKNLKGWRVIGGKLYYFTKGMGRMAKDRVCKGINLTKSGAAKNDNITKLKIVSMGIVADITNSSMTKSQKLYKCWQYVTGGRFRYAGKYPNMNKKDWHINLALDMFQTRTGNCYGFACAFAALAKEVGYKPVLLCGRIRIAGGRDHAPDGYTRHSWVKIDDYHYDPEGQYAGWCRGIYKYSNYPYRYQLQKSIEF